MSKNLPFRGPTSSEIEGNVAPVGLSVLRSIFYRFLDGPGSVLGPSWGRLGGPRGGFFESQKDAKTMSSADFSGIVLRIRFCVDFQPNLGFILEGFGGV